MDKLPSENVNRLIDIVLKKHQLRQEELALKMGVRPETVSRWRKSGVGGKNLKTLQAMAEDIKETQVEPVRRRSEIPFHVTIPRRSLKISVDENGDFDIRGIILALLDRED